MKTWLNKIKTATTMASFGMIGFGVDAFALGPGGGGGNNASFQTLQTNVSNTEYHILYIVQIVVTLAAILLAFRGVIHLKQNASGSPQEKHLSKGLANIIFSAALFIVVPILHMMVGSLGNNLGADGYNSWSVQDANSAKSLSGGNGG